MFYETITLLGEAREIIPLVAIGGGLAFALIIVLSGMVSAHFKTRQQEQTKREIAAYIAEGSMTPDEGERIIRASAPPDQKSC